MDGGFDLSQLNIDLPNAVPLPLTVAGEGSSTPANKERLPGTPGLRSTGLVLVCSMTLSLPGCHECLTTEMDA